MFNGEIFFDSSGVAQQIFIIISIVIQFFPFQIPACSLYFARSNNGSMRFPVLDEGCYCCSSIFRSYFPISRFRIHDMF